MSYSEARSLEAYRGSLGEISRLDRAEERDLGARWEKGDEGAGEQMIEACLPFVMAVAMEYRRWGVPLEDIIQQGNVGLLRAAAKFDLDKDCRLATYANYWIRAEIRDYVVRSFRVVRLGTTKAERRALRAYRAKQLRDPEELAKASGLSPERVATLLPLLAARESSFEGRQPQSDLRERLPAASPSPEDEAAQNELRTKAAAAVRGAIEQLPAREQFIIRSRMMNDDPLTLEEIGVKLGVSKERVRQLEARAKTKLQEQLEDFREAVTAA